MLSIIPDISINNQTVEVTELIVVHTGMENATGGGGTIDAAFFASHYRNQVSVIGDIDGMNTSFTLPDSNNTPNTERLWYGGSDLILDVDYTISGHTITMLWAPINPGTFVASYFYGL